MSIKTILTITLFNGDAVALFLPTKTVQKYNNYIARANKICIFRLLALFFRLFANFSSPSTSTFFWCFLLFVVCLCVVLVLSRSGNGFKHEAWTGGRVWDARRWGITTKTIKKLKKYKKNLRFSCIFNSFVVLLHGFLIILPESKT